MSTIGKMREDIQQREGLMHLCLVAKAIIQEESPQIVEIGSYCGESGEIIANVFSDGIVNCVDPWSKYTEEGSVYDLDEQEKVLKAAELIFDEVVMRNKSMIKNKMSSTEYASKVQKESIDFVYIDGNHQYSSIMEDLQTWYGKVKKGGIIAGHDYNWEGVRRATNLFFNNKAPFATFADSSWFYIKS